MLRSGELFRENQRGSIVHSRGGEGRGKSGIGSSEMTGGEPFYELRRVKRRDGDEGRGLRHLPRRRRGQVVHPGGRCFDLAWLHYKKKTRDLATIPCLGYCSTHVLGQQGRNKGVSLKDLTPGCPTRPCGTPSPNPSDLGRGMLVTF